MKTRLSLAAFLFLIFLTPNVLSQDFIITCDKDVYVCLRNCEAICNITNNVSHAVKINITGIFPTYDDLKLEDILILKNVTYNVTVLDYGYSNITCYDSNTSTYGSWIYDTSRSRYVCNVTLGSGYCQNLYSVNFTNDTCEYYTVVGSHTETRWKWSYEPFDYKWLILLPSNKKGIRGRHENGGNGVAQGSTVTVKFKFKVPISSEGKFDIEVKGDSGEYSLLDPWWNSNWLYRRNITITELSGKNLTDYQVLINLTYDSDMQSDFSDIRFTWYNATDGTETEASYYVDDYVSSNYADVWVKVPEIPANGSTTVYVYYGNQTPVTSESTINTFTWVNRDMYENAIWHIDDTVDGLTGDGGTMSVLSTDTYGDPEHVDAYQYKGVYVDGNDGYGFQVETSPTQPRGVCMWIKPNATTDGIIYEEGGIGRGYNIYIKNGELKAEVWTSTCNYLSVSAGSVQVGRWYHVCFSYEPDVGGHFWVNGTKIGTISKLLDKAATDEDGLGGAVIDSCLESTVIDYSYYTLTNGFDGVIDEVYIFDKVLTDYEVSELYKGRYEYKDDNWILRMFTSPEPTYTIGSEETAEYISITLNYTSVDFGSLIPSTTNNPATDNGLYGIEIDTNCDARLTFYSPSTPLTYDTYTIPNENLKFNYTFDTTSYTTLLTLDADRTLNVSSGTLKPYYYLDVPEGQHEGSYSTTKVIEGWCA